MTKDRYRAARRVLAVLALGGVAAACTPVPVADPGKWDPAVYCATVRPPDPWCKAHGH